MTFLSKLRAAVQRSVTRSLLTILLCLVAGILSAQAPEALRIGIIGTGNIGGALARHWANAGHEVVISSRHPEELESLADELGPGVRAATSREAAAFGDIVLVSIPYAGMPQVGSDYAAELAGKIIIDTGNPVERRDGPMAREWLAKGSGVATRELFPGTRVVRAFNCIPAASLANEGNRRPARYAIPIAGDDVEAIVVAERLIDEAGFDAVLVGPLETARRFDLGQPLAQSLRTAAELRQAL